MRVARVVEWLRDRGDTTPRRRETIAVAGAAAAFALIFCHQLAAHLATLGTFHDWDMWLTMEWAAYRSAAHYHQIPLWNPYECGGMPLLGNPQSRWVAPSFILTLIFGPVIALHLEAVIMSAIAWAGGYVLGRVLGMRRLGAVCTATAFAGSSWFFLRVAEGNLQITPLVYLPWIIAAAWAASERGRLHYAIASGALIALSFLEADPYAPLFDALALALILPMQAVMRRSVRPILVLAIAAVFAGGLTAVKLIPAAQNVAAHPRPTGADFGSAVNAIHVALLSRNQDHERPYLSGWGFHEAGAYVGLFGFAALIGLYAPRRAWPWLIAGLAFFILARGNSGPYAPWLWLHRLPVFSSTRLPQRFLIPCELMISVLAGIGIDVLLDSGSTALVGLAVMIVTAGAVDLYLVGTPNLQYPLRWEIPRLAAGEGFMQLRTDVTGRMFLAVQRNYGIVNCYEALPFPDVVRSSQQPGYVGEQHMNGPGTVRLLDWSPNVLRFDVDAPAPSELVVNQNFDPEWRLRAGSGAVVADHGLLAVRVAAGRQEIVLAYGGWRWRLGALISILTATAGLWLSIDEKRSPLRSIDAPDRLS